MSFRTSRVSIRFVVKSLARLFTTVTLLLCLFGTSAQAQWTNGQDAAYVLGQPNFTTGVAGTTQQQMSGPGGIAIDATNNKLYVVDNNNNRVLRFGLPITSNNPSAEIVFGQPNFTSSGTGTTQNTFNDPRAAAVDAAGNLYIVELNNNRILRFNAAHAIAVNQPNASFVYGQPNFTSSAAATTQTGLSSPFALAVSSVTGDVFVADRQNRRVVRYPAASLTSNGPNANLVLGAANYTTVGSAVPAQNSTPFPNGVTVIGNTLYVSDNTARRVVAFDNIGSKVNGDNADRVLGQPNFTASAAALTATGMGSPARMATDGTNLFVGDGNVGANNRVLIFNNANAKVNGAAADNVLGQPNFTTSGINLTQRGMNTATGLAFVGSVLFAADISQNRVLVFAQSGMNVAGNVVPYNPRPTTTPQMNTMNYGTPTGSPVKVPMNTAGVNSIDVTFSQNLAPWVFSNGTTSPNARDAMKVHGTTSRGYRSGTGFGGSGATLRFTTTASVTTSFNPGEQVWVTVTNAQSTGFAPTRPFVMGFRTAAGTGPAQFIENVFYPTTSLGYSITTADINNDGILDMITADPSANNIRIRRGNGNGTFGATPTDLAFTSPRSVRAADFNNDGVLDLVATASTNLSVRMNSALTPGTFGGPVNLSAGGFTLYVTVGDYDADGNMDVAASGLTSLFVFLGNGDGTFQTVQTYPLGGTTSSYCESGDIDGDGDVDIVFTNTGGGTLRSVLNDGNGGFSVGFTLASPSIQFVTLGDVNNDGRLDAVSNNFGTNGVRVYIGNGDGSFAAPIIYSTGVGSDPRNVILADFDGVNGLDIGAALRGTNAIGILLNNGSGAFGGVNAYPTSGIQTHGLASGDLDGDGDMDVLANYETSAVATVHLNSLPMNVAGNLPPFTPRPTTTPLLNTMNYGTPTGSPVRVPISTAGVNSIDVTFSQSLVPWVLSNGLTSPSARDVIKVHGTASRGYSTGNGFTGSGAMLRFTTSATFGVGEQLWVSVTNAQGTTGLPTTRPFVMGFRTATGGPGVGTFIPLATYPDLSAGTSLLVGDFNGDANANLDVIRSTATGASRFLGAGDGTMGTPTSFPASGGTGGLAAADFNNDGLLDFARNANGASLFVHLAPAFTATNLGTFPAGNPSVIAADFNGDGLMDIVSQSSSSSFLLVGNGDGTFQPWVGIGNSGESSITNNMQAGDVDGDGDIDIVYLASLISNQLRVALNNGVGTFTSLTSFSSGGTQLRAIAVADYDGDGILDIAACHGTSSDIAIHRGIGNGTFLAPDVYPLVAGTGAFGIVAGDFNADGRMDLAVTGRSNNTVSIFLRNAAAYTAGSAFASVVQYPTALQPQGIAAGDIDNDGDLDLVITHATALISVFLNAVPMTVQGNVPPYNPRPTTTPLMNTMDYGTPTLTFPRKVPMDIAGVNGINVTFSQPLQPWVFSNAMTSPNARDAMKVHGTTSRGYRSGVGFAGSGATLQFTTTASVTRSFNVGEQVWVSVTNAQGTSGPVRPFVMSFRTKAGSGPAQFVSSSLTSVANTPQSIATGDFNGDGYLDLAASNTNSVDVLINTGTGSYLAPDNYLVSSPTAIATGDFDSDGDLDLAVTGNGSIRILLNTGAGLYAAAVVYGVGAGQARSIAVGDYNGDGDLDLAVTKQSGNTVEILLNTGSGTFGANVGYTVGTTPWGITNGDFDNDGDIDLAVANQASNNVSILLNTGLGVFASPVNYGAGSGPNGITAGDFNGDGYLDLAVTNLSSSNISVFLNTATGAGVFWPAVPYTVGSGPQTIVSSDFDGNGTLDLAVSCFSSNLVSVLLNPPATPGVYSPALNYGVGTGLSSLVSGDLDGDGDLDIATTIAAGANSVVAILLNSLPINVAGNLPPFTPLPTTVPLLNTMNYGTPTLTFPRKVPMDIAGTNSIDVTFSQPLAPWVFSNGMTSPTARDAMKVFGTTSRGYRSGLGFMASGAATLQFTTTASVTSSFNVGEQVWVTVTNAQSTGGARTRPFVMGFRTRAGSGPAQFPTQTTLTAGTQSCATATGDFDGDGDMDVVAAALGTSNIFVYLNTGTGTFTGPTPYTGATGMYSVGVADLNNDGALDIVAGNNGSGTYVFLNQNLGTGTFFPAVFYNHGTGVSSYAFGDMDADGDLDMVFALPNLNSIGIRLNNGAGVFGASTGYSIGASTGPNSVIVADLDGDGDLDVAVANQINPNVAVLMNNGTGMLGAVVNNATPGNTWGLAAGDINGDRFIDLVSANRGANSVSVFVNSGTGTFTRTDYTTGFTQPQGVTLDDFDGNGELDIAVSNSTIAGTVRILLNTGGVFSAGISYATGALPYSIASGDVDGDGDIDLVTPNYNAANVSVLLNTLPMNVAGNLPPFTPRPTTTPLMNTMNYGTPTLTFPRKVPMDVAGTNSIDVTFSQPLAPWVFSNGMTSPNARDAMKVFGTTSRGYRSGQGFVASGATTLQFTTTASVTSSFNVGEQVWVTVTNAQSTGGASTRPFVMGFRTAAGTGPGTFSPFASYPTANTGWATRMADFDGDGNVDVVTANTLGTNSSVFFGAGNGTTGIQTPYGAGNSPQRMSVADFNNDGKLDYVFSNSAASVVTVSIKGTGLIFAPTNIAVGGNNGGITTADFNGDGNMDIVVRLTTGMLQYLQGNGDGTFQAAVNTVSVGGTVTDDIAAGDFNGDGAVDVIALIGGTNQLRVLLGSGLGSFSALTVFSAGGTTPHTAAVADYDADGILDIAVSLSGSNTVAIHRGNGDGTFQAADAYSTGAGTAPRHIVAGDFNGDGRMDIAGAGFGTNSLCVLLRNAMAYATGSAFAPVVQYSAPFTSPHGIDAGDVDGDGDMDIVMNYTGAAQMTVFLNTVPMNVAGNLPPFTPRPATTPLLNTMNVASATNINIPFSANVNPATVTPANFRVHGLSRGLRTATPGVSPANTATLTGITSSFLPNEQVFVSVTNAQSTGGASTRPFVMGFRTSAMIAPLASATLYNTTTYGTGFNMWGGALADFNNDGFLDYVAGTIAASPNNRPFHYRGDGAGNFASRTVPQYTTSDARELCVGDFNNDGWMDVAQGLTASSNVNIFLNNATTGDFLAPTAVVAGFYSLCTADFNGDGNLDLAGVDYSTNLRISFGNGAGGFPTSVLVAGGVSTPGRSVRAGDFDGDGDIDLAVVSETAANNLRIFANNGLGTFAAVQTLTIVQSVNLDIGDIDGNGTLDIVAVQFSTSSLQVLTNTAGVFAISQTLALPITLPSNEKIALGDMDGDGDLDVVMQQGTVCRNNGLNSGTFSYFSSQNGGNSNSNALALGDIDGDGDLDAVYTNYGGTIDVFKNGTQPLVTTVTPTRNGNGTGNPNIALGSANVTVNFSTNITTNTYSVPPAQQLFQVHGGLTGSRTLLQGSAPNGVYSGPTLSSVEFNPSADFRPGELVSVTVTNASSSVAAPNNSEGIRTRPYTFDYRVATGGSGVGTFTQLASYATSGFGQFIKAGYINNDNLLDVVTMDNASSNTRFFAGTGGGAMAVSGSGGGTGTTPLSLLAGDFDNNGSLDYVVGNAGSANITIRTFNPGGNIFSVPINRAAGANNGYIAAADFNADGRLDVAAKLTTGDVNILFGTGLGGNFLAPVLGATLGAGGTNIEAGDFDGDGDMDIIGLASTTTVQILVNNGAGGFSTPFAAFGTGFSNAHTLAVADFNNDGRLDIVVSNSGSDNVVVFRGNGDCTFTLEGSYSTGAGTQPRTVIAGDFNADGTMDIAVAGTATNTLCILLRNGAATAFAPVASYPAAGGAGAQITGLAAGDADNDGDLDIVANYANLAQMTVFLNAPVPTVFYYQSGDAGLPASWNSAPNGSGSPATAFTSPATDFYVGVAGAVTATVNTSFAIGPFVSLHVTSPSVLAVSNGITITNNGFLNVSGATVAGATLRLIGTG
ncbi:MAG: hypothetical protein EAZ92_16110, partial [Candidatus Kapaibacterium sp.]